MEGKAWAGPTATQFCRGSGRGPQQYRDCRWTDASGDTLLAQRAGAIFAKSQVVLHCVQVMEDVCLTCISASRPVDCARHREPSSGSQEGGLLQLQMSEPLVSEEDTQELRQVTYFWGLHLPLQMTPFSFLHVCTCVLCVCCEFLRMCVHMCSMCCVCALS